MRKAFLAVHAVAGAADARGEHDLSALSGTPLPAEIRPFVEAINRLLLRMPRRFYCRRRIGATITLSGSTQAGNTGLRVEIRLPAVAAGRQSDIS